MFICPNCGAITDDVNAHQEFRGYQGEEATYELTEENCECGGYFLIAAYCPECDELVPENDILNGKCEKCRDKEYENEIT